MRLKEYKVYLAKVSLAFLIAALASCVPVPESGKEKADCGTTQAFNSVSRKCYAVNAIRSSPVPSTSTATISEDSGVNSITLNYTDTESDYATSCNVVSASATMDGDGLVPASCSCVGGICTLSIKPDLNFNGTAQAIYNLSDDDGVSSNKTLQITVSAVDDAPLNVSTVPATVATINEDTTQLFYLNYSDAENDSATSCAVVNSTYLQTTTACACNVLGVCTVTLSGTTNYNGIGQNFQYRVYANGQWSSYSTVFVDVSSVNDTPILTSGTQSVTLAEDNTAAPGDIILVAGTDPDATTNGDILTYTVTVAESHGTISNCAGGTFDRDCYYQTTADKNDDNIYANCLYGGDIRFVAKTAALADGAVTITFTDNALVATAALSYAPTIAVVGNAISITINNTNTTGVQIKTAIEASASANALVGVYLLAGRGVTAASTGMGGDGIATAAGTCHLAGAFGSTYDTFTYKATDTLGPTDSASTRTVTVNVTPVNDAPTDGADFLPSTDVATEDTTFTFSINGTINEVDLKDNITCAYVSASSNLQGGTLTNCLGQTGSSGTCDLTCTYVPYANYATETPYSDDGDEVVVAFTYSDGTLTSGTQTVEFDVAPVNDAPIICNYATYRQAPECGLKGCIDSKTPVGYITPSSHTGSEPIYYFDSTNVVCYKSTGSSTSSDWTAVATSFIGDYEINEKQTLYIDNIRIDEGGGDSNENTEEVTFTAYSSSDANLIPLSNIKLYFDQDNDKVVEMSSEQISTAYAQDLETGASDDAGLRKARIAITPQGSQVGSSTIVLRFSDDGGTTYSSVSFTVTVNPVSAQHNGWKNIQALGPKMDKFGQYRNSSDAVIDRFVCNYNRAKCNNKQACTGAGTPVASMYGDVRNVLYWDSTNSICYLNDGEIAVGTKLKFRSLKSNSVLGGAVTVALTDDGTISTDTATVSVSGRAITINMDTANTTVATILSKMAASTTASALATVRMTPGQATTDLIPAAVAAVTLTDIASTTAWTAFESTCNISDSDLASECSTLGGNCIGTTTEYVALDGILPSGLDHYYHNISTGLCKRSIGYTGVANELDAIDAGVAPTNFDFTTTSEVTLEWEAFSVIGSGSITGYNVYRRAAFGITNLTTFNYEWPINKTVLSSTATSYTDNITNSWLPPVAGTAYYYEVRPLVTSIETATNESFNKIRVVAPPPNMAFAHRWIMNKSMCQLMGYSTYTASTMDPANHFRCPFKGWGGITGSNYYDIGQDYLTSRYEFGCPYSAAPACSWTTDGSCIAASAPTGNSAAEGTVFYNRGDGVCYVQTAAGVSSTWSEFNTAAGLVNTHYQTANKYMSALLPPISNISAAAASYFCGTVMGTTHTRHDQTTPPKFMINGLDTFLTYALPTRKEQIALGQWHPDTSDTAAKTLEEGLSLNSSSKCNSSSASGLSSGYTNADYPASANLYSLPGTQTSGILSMATGSQYTSQCVTRYGIQDFFGNVSEWTSNEFAVPFGGSIYEYGLYPYTSADASAITSGAVITSNYTNLSYEVNSNAFDVYAVGPIRDSNGDGASDANFNDTSFTISDELYSIGYLNIPYGLPVNTAWTSYAASPWGWGALISSAEHAALLADLSEIGSSSGITSAQLRGDTISLYTNTSIAHSPISGGGSYLDGTGAGTWNFKMSNSIILKDSTIGFRCIAPIPNASYSELDSPP